MITTAFDELGNLWDVHEPGAPDHAVCALCEAAMYRRTSVYGNPHYVLMNGEKHAFPECRKLDSWGNMLDSTKTSLTDIWAHNFAEETENEHNSPQHPTRRGKTRGPAHERKHGILSLQQICAAGYLHAPNRLLHDGNWLSSLTINPIFSYILLGLQKIDKRILQGCPCSCDDQAHIVTMKIYIAKNITGKTINRYLTADIQCPDDTTYSRIKSMLFQEIVDPISGKKKYVRKTNRIAVMADWEIIPTGECRCRYSCEFNGWKCIGRLRTTIVNAKSMCIVPDKKKGKNTDSKHTERDQP